MTSKPRPKKYACLFEGCDRRYSRPALLVQHERTHNNDRPFACDYEGCDKAFFRKSHLEVHKCSHRKDNEKPFQCKVCGKGCIDAQRLRRHELTHTKKHKCPYEGCNEAFYHHVSYKHHIETVHEMVTVCDVCHRRFQNKVLVAKHKLKEHGDGQTFSCTHPGCFSTFITRQNLNDHIRKAHPTNKCDICEEIFESLHALKAHKLLHQASPETHERDESLNSDKIIVDDVYEVSPQLVVLDETSNESTKKTLPLKGKVVDVDAMKNTSFIKLLQKNFKPVYKCPKTGCGKVFERRHAFDKHMKRHEIMRLQAAQKYEELKREEEKERKSLEAERELDEPGLSDHFSDLDESDIIDIEDSDKDDKESQDKDTSMEDEITDRQRELDMMLAQEMQSC